MDAKHTPGPWWFREYAMSAEDRAFLKERTGKEAMRMLTNAGGVVIMSGDPEGDCERVCEVDIQTRHKRGKGSETPCPVRDANAHLIAAAPDMLAALKGLVADQHGHAPGCGCPWCAARAAIARAEGR